MDRVDFRTLRCRLSQNGVQEKLTKLWVDRCLQHLGERPAALSGTLFDHLVGKGKQAFRNGEAERVGGLQVNDQIKLGNLLDRKIARMLTLEDAPGIGA